MRTLLLIVALMVLGGGAWMLLRAEGGAPAWSATPSDDPQPPDNRGAEAAVAEAKPAPTERTELAPPEPVAFEEGQVGYRIRVVGSASGEPLPGATVHWIPATFDYTKLSLEEQHSIGDDHAGFVVRAGQSRTANAQGLVTIPAQPEGVQVFGLAGSLYGQAYFRVKQGAEEPKAEDFEREFTLKLTEDVTLTARAVDVAGRPVPGVRLVVNRNPAAGEQRLHLQPQRTDEAGLLRVRHAQELFAEAAEVTLAAALFGGTGDAVPVEAQDLSRDPIDVPLPAHGSLEIVLLGPDGSAWETAEGTDLRVTIQPAGQSRSGVLESNHFNLTNLGTDGRVVAHPVLCGQEFNLALWAGAHIVATVSGPKHVGERVRAELRMPADTPVLIGRAVDGRGADLRSLPIQVRVRPRQRHRGGSRA